MIKITKLTHDNKMLLKSNYNEHRKSLSFTFIGLTKGVMNVHVLKVLVMLSQPKIRLS